MKQIYNYIKLTNYIFWNRIVKSTKIQESSLGIFRWIFGFFFILFANPKFIWISEVPDAFFNPPYLSFANLFKQFPNYLFFYVINILILISIFLLTIGVKTRLFNFILLLCLFLGNNFRYSFGKIDHHIMLLVLLLCMFFSNWGAYYALIPDQKKSLNCSIKALAVLSVLLAFGMFTAGYEKALNWVDFDFSTNGFLSWFYPGYYNLNKTAFLASTVTKLPKWIFEFADYAAVIFELSAFFALFFSRKLWLFWLLIACLFHLSNTLLLNIPFITHFVVYLAFINYYKLKNLIFQTNNLFTFEKLKYFLSSLIFSLFLPHFLLAIYGQNFKLFPSLSLQRSILIWILAAIIIFLELLIELNNSKKKLIS